METYFFTNKLSLAVKSDLNFQDAAHSFGPVSIDKFRTTSSFTTLSTLDANVIPYAIAVTDGLVAIQDIPETNPQLVTLVLKPNGPTGLGVLSVAYFVYRGILKSSLIKIIQDEDLTVETVETSSSNDLVSRINYDAYEQLKKSTNNSNIPFQPVSGTILGTDLDSLDDSNLIEDLFSDSSRFQAYAGNTIGVFGTIQNGVKSYFGFDILLNEQSVQHTLGDIRKLHNEISLKPYSNSGTPTQFEEAERRYEKEKILAYVDPCAYYGLNGIGYKDSNGNRLESEDLSEYFFNHDLLYIDIRNENNLSYAFYEDNTTLIKDFAIEGVSIGDLQYATDGWPIFKYKFSSNTNNLTPSTNNFASLDLKISFQNYSTDENDRKAFLLAGTIADKNGLINFIFDRDRIFEQTSKKFNSFPIANRWANIGSGKVRKLAIKVNTFNNVRSLASSYIRLYVHRVPETINTKAYTLRTQSYLDNLFILNKNQDDNIKPKRQIYFELSGHMKYLDHPNLPVKGLYESGIAYENNRIFFFAVPKLTFNSEGANRNFYFQIALPDRINISELNIVSIPNYISNYLGGQTIRKNSLIVAPENTNRYFLTMPKYLFEEKSSRQSQTTILLGVKRLGEFDQLLTHIQTPNSVTQSNIFNSGLHPVFIQINSPESLNTMSLSLSGLKNPNTVGEEPIPMRTALNITVYGQNTIVLGNSIYTTNAAADLEPINLSPVSPYAEGNISLDIVNAQSFPNFQSILTELFNNNEVFKNQLKTTLTAAQNLSLRFRVLRIDPNSPELIKGSTRFPVDPKSPAFVKDQDSSSFFTIEIDETYIQQAKPIAIALTCIHELLHAKHMAIIKMYGIVNKEGNPDYRFGWSLNNCDHQYYYRKYGMQETLGNSRNFLHNLMAEREISIISNCLKEFNNKYPQKETNLTHSYNYLTLTNTNPLGYVENIGTFSYSGKYIDGIFKALAWDGLEGTTAWRIMAKRDIIKVQEQIAIGQKVAFNISNAAGPINALLIRERWGDAPQKNVLPVDFNCVQGCPCYIPE